MLGDMLPAEMEALLRNNRLGRIACHDGQRPYIVPVHYHYERGQIYCHSRNGLKIEMMRRHPTVCFEVEEIKDFSNWRTVIAWGEYEEITDEEESSRLESFFSDYLLTAKTTFTPLPPHLQKERFRNQPAYLPTIFYRIVLTEITGRYEQTV